MINQKKIFLSSSVALVDDAYTSLMDYGIAVNRGKLIELFEERLAGVSEKFKEPDKLVAVYLKNLIADETKTTDKSEGSSLFSNSKELLINSKGISKFLDLSKAEKIFCVYFINAVNAVNFKEAVLKCQELVRLEIEQQEFICHPRYSLESFEESGWQIFHSRKKETGAIYHMVQNKKFGDVILPLRPREYSTPAEAYRLFIKYYNLGRISRYNQ